MFEDYQICPYTGLRSFTEEESIYFKGREDHIQQATELLEKNKFLMLTGASGDGKSSLVFAGIVPNAKAGFMKSEYTNWRVVDFRPERNPLKNLSISIARELDIDNPKIVEAELGHGFSALIDLYKSSSRYLDENSIDWQKASEEEKKAMSRETANLIILADQFEEFFTNPENYRRGIPSQESNLVINLLLETARLAYEENLPIYIVFTMRSDYIGQCAAFRGLPEYIGFSQFFVPRLNRVQLQQVIEEPATLSGNRISRRLTERLIHDVTEGVDQLPILQHALNQVWEAADKGKEEMDLIHYAKVGGIAAEELPDEDEIKFNSWFNDQAQKIKNCYHKPSLQNVLDTHANKLFVTAVDYYIEKGGNQIDDGDIKEIIKNSFSCLTKIDQSRAVRNRMTLNEISEIIGNKKYTTSQVGLVLNLFREPGNTFIRPFINEEDPESITLKESTILDITHESLIRNWVLLEKWADEEYNHYITYRDFYQQVNRWVQNDKSRGFLLPIGPLTFFEDWFEKLNPNKYWVNRYLKTDSKDKTQLANSQKIIDRSTDFINRSRQRHAITRAVMKFGPRKIAAVIAVIILIVSTSFFYNENRKKQNHVVMEKIQSDALIFLKDKKVQALDKGIYLIEMERYKPGSANEILDGIESNTAKLEAIMAAAVNLVVNDRKTRNPIKDQLILKTNGLVDIVLLDLTLQDKTKLVSLINYIDVLEFHNFHFEDPQFEQLILENSRKLGRLILKIINDYNTGIDGKHFNEGIERALRLNGFFAEEIKQLIAQLSPFELNQSEFSKDFFNRSKTLNTGALQDQFAFNGLYQILGYLYATQGEVEKTVECVKILRQYHSAYDNYQANDITVGGYFITFDKWAELDQFAEQVSDLKGKNKYEYFERMIDRSGYVTPKHQTLFPQLNINPAFRDQYYNLVLDYLAKDEIEMAFNYYEKAIKEGSNSSDELNYLMATLLKRKGVTSARIDEDKNRQLNFDEIFKIFDASYKHYLQISEKYLAQEIPTFWDLPGYNASRKEMYIYPDYRERIQTREPRNRYQRYINSSFFLFLRDRNLLNEFYVSFEEADWVRKWVEEYKTATQWGTWFANEMSITTLESIDDFLTNHPLKEQLEANLIKLLIADLYFKNGQDAKGLEAIDDLDPVGFSNLFTANWQIPSLMSFQLIGNAYYKLLSQGDFDKAFKLMTGIDNTQNRTALKAYSSTMLAQNNNKELAEIYLDSALIEEKKIISINQTFWDYRRNIAYAIAMIGGESAKENALAEVRNSFTGAKTFATGTIMMSLGFNGNYYPAYSDFPRFMSNETKLLYIQRLLAGINLAKKDPSWVSYDYQYNWNYNVIGYVD